MVVLPYPRVPRQRCDNGDASAAGCKHNQNDSIAPSAQVSKLSVQKHTRVIRHCRPVMGSSKLSIELTGGSDTS